MLTRRERTEVLVESGSALALELASLVEADTPAWDIVPAHQGLVMCQVRETARNSRFYLSEVLVTESRVRVGEADGLGVLMGTDAAHARALAVIDAAYAMEPAPACMEELERRIDKARVAVSERMVAQDARTYVSRVEFDEMSGQDMSVQAVVK